MNRFPSALLFFTLGAFLVGVTIILEGVLGEAIILPSGLAIVMILLGLVRTYYSEQGRRILSHAVVELIASIETDLAADRHPEEKTKKIKALLDVAELREDRALAEACKTLFVRFEQTLRELKQMAAEWEKTFDSVEDGIVILDRERRIVRINRSATRMLDLDRTKCIDTVCCGQIHREGCDPENCSALLMQETGKGMRGELSTLGDDILEVFTSPLVEAGGERFGSVHLLRDIGKDLRSARQAQEIMQVDSLTGLPNRDPFRTALQKAIEAAYHNKEQVVVLLIDLDGFSVINNGLGHAVGDQLLHAAADRLRQTLSAGTYLGRLGGDEFALFFPSSTSALSAVDQAHEILATFSEPFRFCDTQPFYCTASIGVSIFPHDAHDASQLLKHADVAMYHAKQHGRNTFRIFTRDMDTKSLERLRLGTNLRHALERKEFELYYQPRVDLATNTVTSMEALLRWTNIEFGQVPPGRFIPLAEENGLILPIGEWVLRTACHQMQEWIAQGLQPPKVAVNLSALQLKTDDLVESVAETLRNSGLEPGMLELELTETVLMGDHAVSVQKLTALREMGITIALDDFGTGYSSLNYLKTFPIDHIKIDRSFIKDICRDADDASIVEVIISIAHTLGLKVVAEGVETREQLNYLIEHQCDEIQGYFFSPPRSVQEITAFFPSQQIAAKVLIR